MRLRTLAFVLPLAVSPGPACTMEDTAEADSAQRTDTARDSGAAADSGTEVDTDTAVDTDSDPHEDSGTDSGDSGDVDTDTDTDADPDPSFTVTWDSSGVTLSITDGGRATYLFGMAEQTSNGWLGEDGFEGPAGEGRGGDYDINHDAVTPTGITLTTVVHTDDVVPNSTTLLTDTVAAAGHIAYIVFDGSRCWEQNDDSAINYYPCL